MIESFEAMLRRRDVLRGAGVFLAAGAVDALAADAEPRLIGWLGTATRTSQQPIVDSFATRLQARGHRIGRDVVIASRFGEGSLQALPALARELVALRPAVIVAMGSPCTSALQQETRTIPIVMSYAATPVEIGLVASLARPGGNITGTTGAQPELAGKLLEMLRDADPRIARVAIILNPDNLGIQTYIPFANATARRLGMTLLYVDLRRPEDLRLPDLDRFRPDALYVLNDFVVTPLYPVLVQYAQQHKLASIGIGKPFTQSGGLLGVGADSDEMEGNVVDYVDRILRGASPALMPVREPARYELVVNRKAARAIGLALSQELLLRAREVIE